MQVSRSRLGSGRLKAAAGALATMVFVLAAGPDLARGQRDSHEVDGRRSGYLYNSLETRLLQDDDFLNPGFFALERGRELWSKVQGDKGKSCASCHEEAEMRGVAARYPVYDEKRGGLVDLTGRVNEMLTAYMGAQPLATKAPTCWGSRLSSPTSRAACPWMSPSTARRGPSSTRAGRSTSSGAGS